MNKEIFLVLQYYGFITFCILLPISILVVYLKTKYANRNSKTIK